MSKKENKKKELKKYFDKWKNEVINNPNYDEPTKKFLLSCKKDLYSLNKKALKNGITIEEIEKIERYASYFYSKTYDNYLIREYNGFVAAGIFKIPADHKTKEVNPIFIYACGHNKEWDDIEEQINVELTLGEAEDLVKCINICIKIFKEKEKNKNE